MTADRVLLAGRGRVQIGLFPQYLPIIVIALSGVPFGVRLFCPCRVGAADI